VISQIKPLEWHSPLFIFLMTDLGQLEIKLIYLKLYHKKRHLHGTNALKKLLCAIIEL